MLLLYCIILYYIVLCFYYIVLYCIMLRDILNKSWKQLNKTTAIRSLTFHLKNHSSKTNKTCRTLLEKVYEFISNVLLWTLNHGRASVGRPARTYLYQLCTDAGCSLEVLPGAIDDRDGWRERVRDIPVISVT